ncbi:hypothetical protein HII31_04980 [Pseudocercospora fuligena]|uniref:Carboxymuconolactone decarboxylase-like domain-containing protein n=1 Tax=Pseudocercospora fuligena TaxID=685502 RepID=A0A8H6VMK1_9PEZI|nr:hypothetical protein HII31_04980 [Pseudocercospora fuligena]
MVHGAAQGQPLTIIIAFSLSSQALHPKSILWVLSMAPRRFELVPNPPTFTDPEEAKILEAVKAQRGAAGLSELDLALLHSPKVLAGWKTFFQAIREGSSIGIANRELAISRIGIINGMDIEFRVHSVMALTANDATLTQAALDHVRDTPLDDHNIGSPGPGGLEPKHVILLAYTDAVSKSVKVSDDVFNALKAAFDVKQILDLTVLIAAYNAVCRIAVPLQLFQ